MYKLFVTRSSNLIESLLAGFLDVTEARAYAVEDGRFGGNIMRRIATLTALAAAMAASMVVAQLQPRVPTGSMITTAPTLVNAAQAGAIRKAFARCIFRHDPALTVRYLSNSDPVAVDYAGAGVSEKTFRTRFGTENCLGEQVVTDDIGLRMTSIVFRAMIAEEAYLATIKTLPAPLPVAAPASVARRFVAVGADLPRARAVAGLADCVVRQDWAGSDALLRTMPGSVAEGSAAQALVPSISRCFRQGQTVSLTAASIRAFVADGAWQTYARPNS